MGGRDRRGRRGREQLGEERVPSDTGGVAIFQEPPQFDVKLDHFDVSAASVGVGRRRKT